MNPKKILIVDDSEFDRGLFRKALESVGHFQTLEANSGDASYEILEREKIDLVLMDIMMPGGFGTEVLLKIRKKFNALLLPIIMVTSKTDAPDVVDCLRSGANDYITKPVNFEVALSRITTHLKLAEVSLEMSRLKEMAAFDAMITTYNHEINNPLAIAIGCLNQNDLNINREKLSSALWRIADIVKRISTVTEKKEVEYADYADSTKMVKVR